MEDDQLRFPIGKLRVPATVQPAQLEQWIDDVMSMPARMRGAVEGLSREQLDTPYRPGGWTVRQVVHHVPDSHLNAYMRYRLALTEDEPMIRVYDEAKWAELADARSGPLEPSLTLLDALHSRWVALMRSLTPAQWQRRFRHPEREVVSLAHEAGLYAWHGQHHVAHITGLRTRNGWN